MELHEKEHGVDPCKSVKSVMKKESMTSDWLTRTEMLLGEEGLKKLGSARVLVVGLGGVGAYAAEMICRAGIGSMTIVDGDTIHTTNRNRQLPALKSTEGKSKADEMGKRLKDINPDLALTVIEEYIRDERMIEILDAGYDYVVDAIDTLSPKIFLIYHSLQRKLPIVSSMGAGGKYDPLKINITDFYLSLDKEIMLLGPFHLLHNPLDYDCLWVRHELNPLLQVFKACERRFLPLLESLPHPFLS